MVEILSAYFGSELWIALVELLTAASIDALLTIALVVTGRIDVPFEWRKVPRFLWVNLPYVVGVTLGAVLVRYRPELSGEYLIATTGLAAWLARDWRAKWKQLITFPVAQGPDQKSA